MKPIIHPRFKFGIVATLIISGGLPLAGSVLIQFYFSDWRWTQEAFHSEVEAAGTFIALTVAILLLLQRRVQEDDVHFIWVASALIAMGLLDAFHGGVHPGERAVR